MCTFCKNTVAETNACSPCAHVAAQLVLRGKKPTIAMVAGEVAKLRQQGDRRWAEPGTVIMTGAQIIGLMGDRR